MVDNGLTCIQGRETAVCWQGGALQLPQTRPGRDLFDWY